MVALADLQSNPSAFIMAYRLLGSSLTLTGKPVQGELELRKVIAHYDPAQHSDLATLTGTDPNVAAYCLLAYSRWFQGDGVTSNKYCQLAIDLARATDHSNTIGYTLTHVTVLAATRGDMGTAALTAGQLFEYAAARELPFWVAHARAFQGWIFTRTKTSKEALPCLETGLMFFKQINMLYLRPTHLRWMAEAYLQAGDLAKANNMMEEAEELIESSGESWAAADHWSFRGKLALHNDPPEVEKALSCYEKAIWIAKEQKALSFELRAALGMAQLYQSQGKTELTKNCLSHYMDNFPYPEGHEDYTAADRFLQALK
jgi:tetratricopeptide (TPR) repeat protein